MRLRSKVFVQLLEAAEAVGLDRKELASAVSLDPATLADPRGYVAWDSFVALLDLLWNRLDQDPVRMRSVGQALTRAPSYALLQRLAGTVMTPNRIYEIASRWGTPASFPHLALRYDVVSERRLRFRIEVPEPHRSSIAIFHVFEGVLMEVPTLLGLPRAALVSSDVTLRNVDVVIELPPSVSLGGRLRRALRAALRGRNQVDLLEAQRQELAEALAEAQRSTAENREILDRLPDFAIIHRDGVILWMNRASRKALGYENTAEMTGQPLLDLVGVDSREMVRSRMRQKPIADDMPEASEVRMLARDGRVVVVEVSPTQAVIFEGAPARLMVGRDVTDRVRLQQQLVIADRLASIGALAAGVAHEVNNPLAYVLNNIEIAIRDLSHLGDAANQSRAVLGVALEGVDRIRTIVRDLLALSRVDDVVVGPVDVLAVVESTLALAGKNISDNAVLSFEHQPVPPTRGTVARLGQVLLNLITNALESMSAASRHQNQLRVTVRPSTGGGAIVEVADNGVGILPEHTAKVFEPFFTTKAPGGGTGIGLAISQRLVSEMGGELTFESSPLNGTTFRVTLPAWL